MSDSDDVTEAAASSRLKFDMWSDDLPGKAEVEERSPTS